MIKNTLLYLNGRLSKICSVHTKVDSCFCIRQLFDLFGNGLNNFIILHTYYTENPVLSKRVQAFSAMTFLPGNSSRNLRHYCTLRALTQSYQLPPPSLQKVNLLPCARSIILEVKTRARAFARQNTFEVYMTKPRGHAFPRNSWPIAQWSD